MFKGINIIEFTQKFPDKDSCYLYLEELKWGKGFRCSRCGHDQYYRGKHAFSRRCKNCKYEESVTANTLFHGIKMSLLKAFHLTFRIAAKKKGMSTIELGNEVGIQQKSAWLFKRKVQVGMQSDKKKKIEAQVHVDEFVTGGPEKGKPGRSDGKKKKTLIMVEVRPGGKTGRVYCSLIADYTKATLYPIIEATVAKDAKIVTDEYPSYDKLKEKFPKAIQSKSNAGRNFPVLHQQIMNMKGWLRGIHHQCSEKHYQKYLDEYCFRTNRRNTEQRIFKTIMLRVVQSKTKTFKELVAIAHAA